MEIINRYKIFEKFFGSNHIGPLFKVWSFLSNEDLVRIRRVSHGFNDGICKYIIGYTKERMMEFENGCSKINSKFWFIMCCECNLVTKIIPDFNLEINEYTFRIYCFSSAESKVLYSEKIYKNLMNYGEILNKNLDIAKQLFEEWGADGIIFRGDYIKNYDLMILLCSLDNCKEVVITSCSISELLTPESNEKLTQFIKIMLNSEYTLPAEFYTTYNIIDTCNIELIKLWLERSECCHDYAIIKACEIEEIEIIKLVLKYDHKFDPKVSLGYYRTVYNITNTNNTKILKLLLKNKKTNFQYSYDSVSNACRNFNPEIMKILLNDGRFPIKRLKNELHRYHCTYFAIIDACVYKNWNVVKLLLEDPRVDPFVNDNEAFEYTDNEEIMKLFMSKIKE